MCVCDGNLPRAACWVLQGMLLWCPQITFATFSKFLMRGNRPPRKRGNHCRHKMSVWKIKWRRKQPKSETTEEFVFLARLFKSIHLFLVRCQWPLRQSRAKQWGWPGKVRNVRKLFHAREQRCSSCRAVWKVRKIRSFAGCPQGTDSLECLARYIRFLLMEALKMAASYGAQKAAP